MDRNTTNIPPEVERCAERFIEARFRKESEDNGTRAVAGLLLSSWICVSVALVVSGLGVPPSIAAGLAMLSIPFLWDKIESDWKKSRATTDAGKDSGE